MARTTPWLFYEFFVLPNYSDFLDTPCDVRKAFNASLTAFQQADIFYAYYKKRDPWRVAAWPNKRQFLIELEKREPHFITVQSVATVYKHLYSTGSHYDVGSPMSLAGVVFDRAGFEIGSSWGDTPSGDVTVRRRGKGTIPLRIALEAVVLGLWPRIIPEEWK